MQVGPSVTPVTDYNVGFRMYEIDPDVSHLMSLFGQLTIP